MPEPGTKRVVRLGVVGCADIAVRRILPAVVQHDSLRLVAVASRSAEKAERFAARFGCAAVVGYRELLERTDIDAVYLPLPPGLRYHWATEALNAGKHVLAEKPLCTSYDETRELTRLARRRKLVLAENFMFLHHSQHLAVRSLIEDGAIGEVQVFASSFGVPPLDPGSYRYRPELGGGALLDLGVYPVRAAQLYLSPHLEVLGATLRVDPMRGVDVAGSALLCRPDGVAVQLAFGFQHSYRSSYAIWGTRGRISLARAFTPPAQYRPVVRLEQQDRLTEITLPADDQVGNAVGAFADAVLSGADRRTADEESLAQARLVEEVRKVARTRYGSGGSEATDQG
ncbi:Gfo/Idh/MocA family oxidoreductase [Micromonospora sp. NPDC049559]|uniref:Gfo/Idh/MocA family protein n=1 Tax=Micromonospora sp. NPDC049559 TaxID=3155923 RepID=UPI0034412F34